MASPVDLTTPARDLYQHVRVLIAMLVGLCITTLLHGLARFVQHPRRVQVSFLHLGWALSLLLWIVHFWWWEFRLTLVRQWTFAEYAVVLTYPILYFTMATLLFPSDLADYPGYEAYFLSRRKWFFGLLAATFLMDVLDSGIKGGAFVYSLGLEYPIRIGVNLLICLLGILSPRKPVQFALLYLSLIYHVVVIVAIYYTI